MRTQNSSRRLEPEPQMQLLVEVWDKNNFLNANSTQCQLLHWKEAAAQYKELRQGIVPFQRGAEEKRNNEQNE